MIDAKSARTDGRRDDDWASVAVISAAVAVIMLDTFGVSQLLSSIGSDLDSSDTELQWILNASTLSSAIALVPAGRAGDRWGRRRMAVLGLLTFAVGSALASAAPSIELLIAARLVVGLGIGGLVAASLAIVTASVSKRNEPQAIARWTAITAAGAAVGPLAAGWLTEALSWRWFFGVEAVVAVVLAVLVRSTVEESGDPTGPRSLDLTGTAALGVGLGALIYGLMIIPDEGFDGGRAVPALAIGVLGLIVFVLVERRVEAPLLDLSLFLRAEYVAVAVVALIGNWAYAVMIFYVPQYLQKVLDLGAAQAGAVFLLFTVPYGALSLVAGRLQRRYATFALLAIGSAIISGAFVLAGAISVTEGLVATTAGLLVAAVGQALVFNASGSRLMQLGGSPGTAGGALSTVRQLGFLLGLALTGTIVQVTQQWRLADRLQKLGIDTSWDDRREIMSAQSGTTLDARSFDGSVALLAEDSPRLEALSDEFFVEALRVGYWTVAGLCALAVVVSLAVRRPRPGH